MNCMATVGPGNCPGNWYLHGVVLALSMLGLSGCINRDIELYETQLSGQVEVAAELGGDGILAGATLTLEAHHATSDPGQGDLERPLGLIERWVSEQPDAVVQTVQVPVADGEGLVVYGWLDRDGDGVLCALGVNDEPAGLVEIADYPAHEVSFTLTLDSPCTGAELLYP